MKVLVHQGFHKTGTTTLQRTLFRSRAHLRDRLNLLLPQDMMDAGFLARRYAVAPKPKTLRNFGLKFRAVLETLDPAPDKPLLISNEEFAGLIPGRKDVWSYAQTPVLAQALVNEVRAFAGDVAQIAFLFTTRDAAGWMKSVYWQNLRAHRICEDFTEYSAALADGANLGAVVEQVRATIASEAKVISVNASPLDNRLAPLETALDWLGVSSDGMTVMDDQNRQPEGGAELFLELNRSELSDKEVTEAKRLYLDQLHNPDLRRLLR